MATPWSAAETVREEPVNVMMPPRCASSSARRMPEQPYRLCPRPTTLQETIAGADGSVEEVTLSGEVERDTVFLAGGDHVGVADAASRLHDGGDPGLEQDAGAVVEREERVGGGDRTARAF